MYFNVLVLSYWCTDTLEANLNDIEFIHVYKHT